MLNNNNFCACTFQTPEKVLSIVCHPLLLRICYGWLSKRGIWTFWKFPTRNEPLLKLSLQNKSLILSTLIFNTFFYCGFLSPFYGIFVQKSSSYFCSNPIQICLKPSKLPPKQLPTFNFWVVTLKGFRAE